MINTTFIIATSLMLQVIVAIFALYQVREVELRRTWLAIGAALILMSVPRAITLSKILSGEISHPPPLESELVALDVSFLMGLGVAYASRLYRSLKRAHADLLRSQQSLIDSENSLRILFDNTPDAIFTMDQNGIIVNANLPAEHLIGSEIEHIVGRPYLDLPLFKTNAEAQALADISPSTGDRDSLESSFVNEKGRAISVEIRGFEMQIGNDNYQTWIVTDVTEKRRLRVEAESLESQLRHSERLQTVGTLAGGIAHDFNNILTPIVGYTELAIREGGTNSPSRSHLEHVIQGAMRAKDLVKQILAFSRQGSKQTMPLQLQPLITETLALLRASLPTTIEIKTNIDPTCRLVMADPGQIHQVIMNLCTNAFHAMRETGGTLTVGLSEWDGQSIPRSASSMTYKGVFACLTVQDTGQGMEKVTQERIFEPFFTTKLNGQGTGLGLSVAHGIVSEHGGVISVESAIGKGTKFTIFLPLDLHTSPIQVEKESYALTGTERVLVVDDEPTVAEMVCEVLSELGYQPEHRTSSTEALKAFSANPYGFDVVVTDQTMPHKTGVELAADIKRIRPDIPVILMTGFSEKISPDNYRSFGLDGFLMKPVLATTLTRTIRALTNADRLQSAT